MKLAQINAISAAMFAILWMAYLIWHFRHNFATANARFDLCLSFRSIAPLVTQVSVASGLLAFTLIPAIGTLFLVPETLWRLSNAAGIWGWTATGLVVVAIVSLQTDCDIRSWKSLAWRDIVPGIATLCVIQISLQMHYFDAGNWLAYHTLLLLTAGTCIALVGWQLFSKRQLQNEQQVASTDTFVTLSWIATIILSLRATGFDPESPGWTCGGLFVAVVVASIQAVTYRSRRYVYVAAGLLNLGASIWWLDSGHHLLPTNPATEPLINFLLVNVIAFALPTILWRWLDTHGVDREVAVERASSGRFTNVGCHRIVAGLGLIGYCVYIGGSLFADINLDPVTASLFLVWPALASVIIAVTVCFWDPRSRFAAVGLYVAGLTAVATLVDVLNVPPRILLVVGTISLAGYTLLTSYLWSRREKLAETAAWLGIPERSIRQQAGHGWLTPANLFFAAFVTVLGFAAQFEFGESESVFRVAAAQGILIQTLAIGMLVYGKRESTLRYVALAIGVLGIVAFSWSFLTPGVNGGLLNRLVATAAALGVTVVIYGLGFTKVLRRENDWTRAAAKLTPAVGVTAIGVIVLELLAEIFAYANDGVVEISGPAIAVVAATLIGLTVALLVAAILPGRDPLNLSPTRRQAYVYAAEGLLALTFLHVRLTMPYLFSGMFQRYWPLIIIAIAFLGVGLSEFFRRRQTDVLASPLERTGALLPMLPVLGYWISPVEVHYSLLMLAVGVFYGALSAMRRSFGFGILAALAVNGGLWFLLKESDGMGLLEHPQLWLIPPSLCVLAAAYLNRSSLSESQMATIRYLTSTVIYTASTADIFLNGVAAEPWLPMILAGLSIAGIAAGIFLRIRAFLFLGTSFLGLSLLTVIWYAAVDLHQTWLWFVVGILTGVAIIAIFALFEKKRQEIIVVMERLKQWDA